MCGIAGIFASSKASMRRDAAAKAVKEMTLSIQHRGPDGHGLWSDEKGRCVLGHRRLSIIDTSDAGLQPMSGSDERWVITFNGEIYNYRELKPLLQARGVQFKGRTDTEVLLEAIASWGVAALPRLDGMFAFAAFDTVTGKILLARDAYGEKPLYYTTLANGAFAFASELQALELLPGFDPTASLDAMAEVLSFQYIGAPRSIYESVRKLEPGSWMEIDADGTMREGRFYRFQPQATSVGSRTLADLADELEDILVRSLERRLISDVPLGAFLSGGVDSSVVCALARRRLNVPLKTFSAGFSNAPESEHLTARAFAEHLETEHFESIISPDVSDFLENVGALLDEPNGDSSCLPTFLLSKFVRRHVTVAVSGDGGDEMFGGYGRYFVTLDEMAQHRAAHGDLTDFHPGDTYYGGRIVVGNETFIRDLFGFVPYGYAEHIARLRAELDAGVRGDLLGAMRQSDVANYLPGAVLPKVDRMSMRNSLEVRTPFLNTELARFAERLPESVLIHHHRGKLILRELAYRYLPRDLIDLPKQGFALPMSDWARGSLLSVAQEVLLGEGGRLADAFGRDNLSRYFQRQSRQFSPYQLWGVVVLECWLRAHPAVIPLGAKAPPRKPSRCVLDVVNVAPSVFLVAEGEASPGHDPACNPTFDRLQTGAQQRLEELATQLPSADAPKQSRALRLPFWGEPLQKADLARLAPLKDSTVILADLGAMPRFDHMEYLKLVTAGVRRVILSDPYRPHELFELELRRQGYLQRMASAARLFGKRVGGASGSPEIRKVFRLEPLLVGEDRVSTGPIAGIEGPSDAELASDYAMFDGLSQMPPVYGSQDDLSSQVGRYSIWNRCLAFSPIETDRAAEGPFWLVPSNEKMEADVPIRVRRFGQGEAHDRDPDPDRILSAFGRDDAPVDLKPGDRIVVHTATLAAGGAERQWVYLAQGLKEAGYDVVFVTSNPLSGDNGHYLPDLARLGIEHVDATRENQFDQMCMLARKPVLHDLSANWMPNTATSTRLFQLALVLERLQPRVVYSQLDEPNILAALAGAAVGIPRIVLSFRNYNPTHMPYLESEWMLPAYRLAARIPNLSFTGNFAGAVEDYSQWIGFDPGHVAVVPNVIEPERFPTAAPEEIAAARSGLGMKPEDRLVLGVFRLSPEKDPLLFVDVCIRLSRERGDVICAIAGVGEFEGALQERVEAAGLEDRIRLLGRRHDINVLMSAAAVVLQTARYEGMPNALMEAQLLGVPVVATAAGGTSVVVANGESGFVTGIGDADALYEGCIQLLADGAKAESMGQAGRRRILSGFKRETLAPRYLDLVAG